MALFWLWVLAHLIGDFPLQTDRVFYYKYNFRWGILIHIGITALCNIFFTLPFWRYPSYWFLIAAMAGLHLIYDRSKIDLTKRGLEDNTLLFLFDQFLHFATIYLACRAFYWLNPGEVVPLSGFWADVRTLQILSAIVLIVFAIAPVNYFLINDYYHYIRKLPRLHWPFPRVSERIWGYFERGLLAVAILFGGWWLVLIPVALAVHFIFARKRNILDYGLSVFLTALLAILVQRWTGLP